MLGPLVEPRLEAAHPWLPRWRAHELARIPKGGVKVALAENRKCPREVVVRLASDPLPLIRELVAHRRTCPTPLLAQLAADAHVWVRRAVASNPSCSSEVLARLAHDPATVVRWGVANNPNCPSALRRVLAVVPDEVKAVDQRRYDADALGYDSLDSWASATAGFSRSAERAAWALLVAGFPGTLAELAKEAAAQVAA